MSNTLTIKRSFKYFYFKQSCSSSVNDGNQNDSSYYSSNLNLSISSNTTATESNNSKLYKSSAIRKRRISLNEKLIKTRPIWYLPAIDKNLATYLLNGKSVGVIKQTINENKKINYFK